MEWRIHLRRKVAARRFVPDWLVAIVFRDLCRSEAYLEPETDDRARRIGAANPNCVCECVSVGRYGSPGKIQNDELLHSIVVDPVDLDDNDALLITMITHAQKKGMSVLRSGASLEEFTQIIGARIPDPAKRTLFGIATIECSKVRALCATADTEQRRIGDRLFSVLDADMPSLPHHGDIFVTLPALHPVKKPKSAWAQEREVLLNLLSDGFESAADFRGGALL